MLALTDAKPPIRALRVLQRHVEEHHGGAPRPPTSADHASFYMRPLCRKNLEVRLDFDQSLIATAKRKEK